MQKRKILRISACLACIVLLGGLILLLSNRNTNQLYQAVRNYVRRHGEGTVTLAQLTEFDWEHVLYFHYTTPSAIYDAIGVHFGDTDLTTGLLFLKNDEIVYHEFFPQRGRGIDVYPVALTMTNIGQKLRVFQPDYIFEVGTREDAFGKTLYWLQAVD